MAVHYVCQWGYWGKSQEEACGEADAEHNYDCDPDDAHETCGWFVFNSVEKEFDELAKSLKGVESDE